MVAALINEARSLKSTGTAIDSSTCSVASDDAASCVHEVICRCMAHDTVRGAQNYFHSCFLMMSECKGVTHAENAEHTCTLRWSSGKNASSKPYLTRLKGSCVKCV